MLGKIDRTVPAIEQHLRDMARAGLRAGDPGTTTTTNALEGLKAVRGWLRRKRDPGDVWRGVPDGGAMYLVKARPVVDKVCAMYRQRAAEQQQDTQEATSLA